MKAIWTGAIGFGLVNIPVKLYSATQESDLDLDMLDKKDLANIRFKRVNADTGKEVSWNNIVKGYKINDHYVVLTDKDFEVANAQKTKTIEIDTFVEEAEINSMYYEMPYYLQPDKSGGRAYALFREALQKSGKVAVATFVLRSKEHLAILKPTGNAVILNRIRFPQEIREATELNLPDRKNIKPAELKMALTLINELSSKFDISRYHDTYAEDLMKLIKAKARGRRIAPAKLKVSHRSTDLMSQLKASLGKSKKRVS